MAAARRKRKRGNVADVIGPSKFGARDTPLTLTRSPSCVWARILAGGSMFEMLDLVSKKRCGWTPHEH